MEPAPLPARRGHLRRLIGPSAAAAAPRRSGWPAAEAPAADLDRQWLHPADAPADPWRIAAGRRRYAHGCHQRDPSAADRSPRRSHAPHRRSGHQHVGDPHRLRESRRAHLDLERHGRGRRALGRSGDRRSHRRRYRDPLAADRDVRATGREHQFLWYRRGQHPAAQLERAGGDLRSTLPRVHASGPGGGADGRPRRVASSSLLRRPARRDRPPAR